MVWRIGWKIGQWECTIGQSDAIFNNRMESEGLWHVRLDRMDCIRLFISIIVWNALWDKYNKNRIRSVGQWERKRGWDLSKHKSHPIMFVNTNAITLFKIGQWDAGFIIWQPIFKSDGDYFDSSRYTFNGVIKWKFMKICICTLKSFNEYWWYSRVWPTGVS